jgi:hypothetical protein
MEKATEWNWFLLFSLAPPTQLFETNLATYNALRGTRNAITPNKSDNNALHGWWK